MKSRGRRDWSDALRRRDEGEDWVTIAADYGVTPMVARQRVNEERHRRMMRAEAWAKEETA